MQKALGESWTSRLPGNILKLLCRDMKYFQTFDVLFYLLYYFKVSSKNHLNYWEYLLKLLAIFVSFLNIAFYLYTWRHFLFIKIYQASFVPFCISYA